MLCLRRRGSSSGLALSRGSETYHDGGSFFDGLLQKIAQNSCEQKVTKESLGVELEAVRQELARSKKQYEEYLVQLKMEAEESSRRYT